MNLKLRVFFLLYWVLSFSAFDCSSTSFNDLESGHLSLVDLEQYINVFDDEHKNSIDSISDSGSIIASGYIARIDRSDGAMVVPPEINTLNVNQEDNHLLIPMPQHMASFPTLFIIYYLAKYIDDPSIIVQVFNFFAVFVLLRYIQKYIGYAVVLSLRNFPRFLQLQRIDYSYEGGQIVTDLSRWMLVPFAWLTEILLVRHDDLKEILDSFVYIPDQWILLILFIIQLLYIYSYQHVLAWVSNMF